MFEGTKLTRTEIEPALNSVLVRCRLLPVRLPQDREIKADVVAIVETIKSRRYNLLNLIYRRKMSTKAIYHRNRKPLRSSSDFENLSTKIFLVNRAIEKVRSSLNLFFNIVMSYVKILLSVIIVVACFHASLDADVSKTVW